MPDLVEVVRTHGPAYLERHCTSMMPSHVRAVQDISSCRTPILGGHVAACLSCGHEHLFYHSCRNRACPRCGHDATTRWIERQRELLLPVRYFHVVFTLPDPLRRLVRSHQKDLLPLLFKAAYESLAALSADPKFLGAQIGALAVLHTWTRTLEWHPHVHLLVPGGGLAPDGRTWLTPPRRRTRYLVPKKALAVGFRGRFLDLARKVLPGVPLPQALWTTKWIVFAKPAVQGPEKVLDYLGRYVHKTAIGNHAIVANDEHAVTFRYRTSRDQQKRVMTLPGSEFLRRFLQHVPPKGFHRVRAFGLLHRAHRDTLQRLQLLLAPRRAPAPPVTAPPSPGRKRCPRCKQLTMVTTRRLSADACLAFAAAAAAATSNGARAPPGGTAPALQGEGA